MEYALEVSGDCYLIQITTVLILVLMEYALEAMVLRSLGLQILLS